MIGSVVPLRSGPQLYIVFAILVCGILSETAGITSASRPLVVLQLAIVCATPGTSHSCRRQHPSVGPWTMGPTSTGNPQLEACLRMGSGANPAPTSNSDELFVRVFRPEAIGSLEPGVWPRRLAQARALDCQVSMSDSGTQVPPPLPEALACYNAGRPDSGCRPADGTAW